MDRRYSRRTLMKQAAALAAFSMVSPALRAADGPAPADSIRFVDTPFKLGVASGMPSPDGFIVWTRLAPVPYDPQATPQVPIPVHWQVAEDERFKTIVRTGTAIAYPQNAHAVHAEVLGIRPDRQYYYRFHAGAEESPVGRARSLPLVGSPTSSFRLALASCQNFSNGYYPAYRDMAEQDPHLIIHCGDYIYESDWVGGVRHIPVPEARDLNGYRMLYACYKQDPDLQRAHACAAWLSIWDDHEIENDWGGAYSPEGEGPGAFLKRKAAAFKAYYEHMPLPFAARPIKKTVHLYQRVGVGDLLQLDLLDCRQYRDTRACLDQPRSLGSLTGFCKTAEAAKRTMLGWEQERWLFRGLGRLGAKWNTIVQTTMMAPFDFLKGSGTAYDMDGWDSFVSTRQRLLDRVAAVNLSNPVALGGNIHAYYAGVVNRIATDPASKPLISEIVGTSITSDGGGDERYRTTTAQFAENPFARYFENRQHGYVLCDVTCSHWNNAFRVVNDIRDPHSKARTLANAVIEDGIVDVKIS